MRCERGKAATRHRHLHILSREHIVVHCIIVEALESWAHLPSIDGPCHGSVSLKLMDVVSLIQLGLLRETLAAVGKVRLEGLPCPGTWLMPFFEALQGCTHIYHLR